MTIGSNCKWSQAITMQQVSKLCRCLFDKLGVQYLRCVGRVEMNECSHALALEMFGIYFQYCILCRLFALLIDINLYLIKL